MAVIAQRGNDFLDLTKVKPPKEEEKGPRTAGGGVSVSQDTPFPVLQLEITLLKLDRNRYSMGDTVIYEAAIRNVGRDVVVIPWSPYREQVRANENYPPGYVEANVGLVVKDKVFGEQVIFGPWLFGADAAPQTLKKLRPGQTVRIRASGRWGDFYDANVFQGFLAKLPQRYDVHARFTLSRHTFTPQPQPIISGNSMNVELRKRQ
jgi:hypothetical protein